MTTNLASVTRDQDEITTCAANGARVYWHRQLPPLRAELIGEHVLEASSHRVSGKLAHRDELWDRCYRDLMENAERRLRQEIDRLGGHYAHVLGETVDSRRDDVTGEAWLRGRFTYMLYRRPDETRDADARSG